MENVNIDALEGTYTVQPLDCCWNCSYYGQSEYGDFYCEKKFEVTKKIICSKVDALGKCCFFEKPLPPPTIY
jgi:hypothetical protein